MSLQRLLIANRGEIAVRIARTAADLAIETVAIHTGDDADSLHVTRADSAAPIPGRGASGYLDEAAIVQTALAQGCKAIHPGYGFLAEHAGFAARCEQAGLVFVGPAPAQLALFGDKIAARALAQRCGVPVLEGSPALQSAADLVAFRDRLGAGAGVVIKAAAGGGGRGMRVVEAGDDPVRALTHCAAEAQAAFGDGTLYAERYLAVARHLEVQIIGDGTGEVAHLWERECSLQRRYQKLIEIAPAPRLSSALRERLLAAALRLAGEARYRGLGTFEFLIDGDACYFIEANPRLQVEHTVTEEVLGLDLVALQLAVAGGGRLADLGLAALPAPQGYAIQLRINAETLAADGTARPAGGIITRFEPATGPGVRVDSAVYAGYAVNPGFDSLLAKLIVHTRGNEFAAAVRRAERVAGEFILDGPATNCSLLRAILRHPLVAAGALTTRFVETHAAELLVTAAELAPARSLVAAVAPDGSAADIPTPPGTIAIRAPLRGNVISIDVTEGARVRRGQQLAVLEAMKMQHLIEAQAAGVVALIVATVQTTVGEGEPLLFITPEDGAVETETAAAVLDLNAPRADLEEVRARHRVGLDAQRPAAVARRRKTGQRTARENVADLCDAGSFIEYGALGIAAQRRRRTIDDLMQATPADGMITGIGTVNAAHCAAEQARCAVLAYDYTVLAGTQGVVNHKKKDRMFELAAETRLPVIVFTEGGGGRPGDVDADDLISCWLDLPTFTTWAALSGKAPRIAVNSGRCFAGNAVLFGCADITIATANSNIGLAGPAMIEGGGLGRFTPEEIGPMSVQTVNGVVDIAVADEPQAIAAAKQTLGYFQGPRRDWSAADQRRLRHAIPENRLRVYDIRAVIETLADDGSVLELRPAYGRGLITAFIRIEGEPFGLIANDPKHLGGAIDGEGGEKGARFLQLCDAYGLPVVSLCDTPGFMVGPDSEKTAGVRRGSRLIVAGASLSVPLFTVVLRKGYGLGAQAMAGGSFHRPLFTIGWPTAEFGPMGLEGAVQLGFRKELEAETDPAARDALYTQLVARMYEKGKAISVATYFEIDAVIDPADTRSWLVRGLRAAGPRERRSRAFVDVW